MMDLKAVIKDWLPPIILRQLQKGKRWAKRAWNPQPVQPPEWEYVPHGREADWGAVGGWNQASVAENYAARWAQFRDLISATGPLAINFEGLRAPENGHVDIHNQVMTLAYVVGRIARQRDSLSVLDYGGALGHHLVFLQSLFPGFRFAYACCELPLIAAQGKRFHPEIKFYTDDAWVTAKFDLVFASNSLHYALRWQDRLGQLAGAARSAVMVTKLPVVQQVPSFVILQRAHRYGYGTEYLGWCLNQGAFLAAARKYDLILDREFLVGNWEPNVVNAPERLRHKGFLFRKEIRA